MKIRIHCKPGISDGYQLDHIVSIQHGFENNIPPIKIANISNLRFIPWLENLRKQ